MDRFFGLIPATESVCY